MAYTHINEMYGSISLRDRITACIAQEVPGMDPVVTAQTFLWPIIARADWIAAWSSAPKACTQCGTPRDTGARPDVITDQMILAAVQAVKAQVSQPS